MRMNSEMPGSDPPDKSFSNKEDDEDEEVLPGFRFHPTDEELVGFYLRRKVEKKLPPVNDLIKQVDIYKYDPWDLPMSTVGDEEWYFFCKRGRKYRNSIRPNRVTGSGFWKATGIDKPIYSSRDRQDCIGLKKSLVYYRGSAGKGTKTEWMMHEFRLPPSSVKNARTNDSSSNESIAEAAEVWTICRILKRIASYRKYVPAAIVKDSSNVVNPGKDNHSTDSCSKTSSYDSGCTEQYVSFGDSLNHQPTLIRNPPMRVINERSYGFTNALTSLFPLQEPLVVAAYNPLSSLWNADQDIFDHGNWDELRSVVDRAVDPSSAYDCP